MAFPRPACVLGFHDAYLEHHGGPEGWFVACRREGCTLHRHVPGVVIAGLRQRQPDLVPADPPAGTGSEPIPPSAPPPE